MAYNLIFIFYFLFRRCGSLTVAQNGGATIAATYSARLSPTTAMVVQIQALPPRLPRLRPPRHG